MLFSQFSPNFLSPMLHIYAIMLAAFLVTSLMCVLSPLFFIKVYIQVFKFSYFFYSFLFPIPLYLLCFFLVCQTSTFSAFKINSFSFRYFSKVFNILLRSFSSVAIIARSSAYANVYIFFLPIVTPPFPFFFINSSTSAISIRNSNGLNGQPCLSPFLVQNCSVLLSFSFILHTVS